ncbi:MAG: tripartite tricarboxylate transporter substrate binding protein, partial [Roseomonas sp.]|nr:tripartite tricarboxylate transporter substrate binding protein [Roseomonas sp.]
MKKASRRVVLGSALTLPFIHRATAQAPWPDRPVRIIIPFGAGGPIDLVGRLLAEHLKEKL